MIPSSPTSEKIEPFLDTEKPAIPPSPTLIALSLLRQVLHLPDKAFRSWKLNNIASNLLPSFLHGRRNAESARVSSTTWLDGMRGVAAFFVYIRHFAAAYHPQIQYGFGTEGDVRYITNLPIIHLVTSGPAMVSTFFIISGYALSWGPLRALHRQSQEACLQRLSSATFRRAIRLFLPGIVSTFLIMLCISAGLYDKGHEHITVEDMPGFWEPQPPMWRMDPFMTQVQDWWEQTWIWLQIWNPVNHPYDVHLWTLPVEFRCSMILFLALVGFARVSALVRLGLLFACILYCHSSNFWEGWLFFAGSFLAQLKLLQEEGEEYPVSPLLPVECGGVVEEKQKALRTSNADIGRYVVFATGLYLLSSPDYEYASNAPGYIILSTFNPEAWPENWRFPHCIGAALAVYATSSTKTHTLRSLFDNSLSRYLGKISYALYLVHGPIVHMLGFWLVPWCWSWTGTQTLLAKEMGFGVAFVVVTVITIWCSDLFWRGIDAKSVTFAKWVEKVVSAEVQD